MLKHLNIKIFGQVQGVGLRWSVKEKASVLDLKGFIKNENDGSVYIEAEGEDNQVKEFLTLNGFENNRNNQLFLIA